MELPMSDLRSRGQTLLSTVIGIAIFIILANALFTLIRGSFQVTSFNRARIAARHIAQEKVEFIRNLPYDDVGTQGGIPSGPLEQEEQIERNGLTYTVETDIVYIDDTFDQTVPSDLLPTDYKRVRVEVSWEGIAASRKNPVVFVTDIAPRGVETTAGGGTLSIFVIDANGQPVPQADVQITATTNPAVNLSLQTGDNGRIILPGAPPCTSCYSIITTKSGYSTERTYSTSEIANPLKPSLTVLAGELTEVTFGIDTLSTLSFTTTNNRASGFTPLGGVTFQMRGAKTLGTNTDGTSVYKYNQTLTTDGIGVLSVNNLEWDNYQITLPSGSTLDFSGMNPPSPISLAPGVTMPVSLSTDAHTTNSVLVTFVNASQQRIASVSATLVGATPETQFSGDTSNPDFGQAFFPGLTATSYQITATASGYVDYSNTFSVSGRTQETIVLTAE